MLLRFGPRRRLRTVDALAPRAPSPTTAAVSPVLGGCEADCGCSLVLRRKANSRFQTALPGRSGGALFCVADQSSSHLHRHGVGIRHGAQSEERQQRERSGKCCRRFSRLFTVRGADSSSDVIKERVKRVVANALAVRNPLWTKQCRNKSTNGSIRQRAAALGKSALAPDRYLGDRPNHRTKIVPGSGQSLLLVRRRVRDSLSSRRIALQIKSE
jgi:hypothetical protein